MVDKLIAHISTFCILNVEEEDILRGLVREKQVKRKQFLLRTGDQAQYTIFVVDGCLRSYAVDRNGFEHTLQFAPENWWISDMFSLINQLPSEINIDALADSHVLLLSRACQLQIFDRIPKLERYFRILTENALASSNHRTLDSLSLPAKNRYQKFCTLYPTLINTLPQKLIASYIGITPEFLSKLRSEK